MKVEIDFSAEQMGAVAAAVVAELERTGKVMCEPERVRPFNVAEAAGELHVSEDMVRRWVDAGMLDRVPGTGKVLITAGSVRKKQRGEI